MAARLHQLCWDNIMRVLRLLVSVIDELAKLIDAIRHMC
jgi:hypothetical protein